MDSLELMQLTGGLLVLAIIVGGIVYAGWLLIMTTDDLPEFDDVQVDR